MIFDDVFIPWEHVLMDGEYEFAQELVSRFTAYHRASYVLQNRLRRCHDWRRLKCCRDEWRRKPPVTFATNLLR